MGCKCCGCTTTICLTSPCTAVSTYGATDVTVTISSGGTEISSGTTDSTGCVTLPIPSGGSYTVATSGNARYQTTSGMHSLTCGGTEHIGMAAASGYFCSTCYQEPIPDNLVFTGGTGSATVNVSSGSANFTLPQTVTTITTDGSGNCAGGITSNPCTISSAAVDFNFTANYGDACDQILQQWCTESACTYQSGSCPTRPYAYYTATCGGAGWDNQWLQHPPAIGTCLGYCYQADQAIGTFSTPLPVPVNVTVTFPSGTYGAPPISSITITE